MFERIFLWLIISQFVKFVVFIALIHKKSVVNCKLKIMIEKKWTMKWVKTSRWDKTNKNSIFGEKCDMIWYVGDDFFFSPTFLVLRVCTCIKVEVFFFFFLVWVKYQRIIHNRPTSRIFFKEPRGATAAPQPPWLRLYLGRACSSSSSLIDLFFLFFLVGTGHNMVRYSLSNYFESLGMLSIHVLENVA